MSIAERLDLGGRSVLVTGAAAGIGRATAHALAARGPRAVVLLDLDDEGLRAAALELEGSGAAVHAHVADVSDFAAMSSRLGEVEDEVGGVDLLVNAAGYVSASPFVELEPGEWAAVLRSHVKSVFTTCRLLAPGMVERGSGSIVNIASVAGKRGGGFLGTTAYAGAKAAVNGLTKALARELAPHGVRVNSVNPGLTDTARLDALRRDPDVWRRSVGSVPLGRVAEPAEVASVVLYLLSDASSYVTGETLNVDGGIAME
jgi:3-oxoacyl-[acyl-carrier protein] reductase